MHLRDVFGRVSERFALWLLLGIAALGANRAIAADLTASSSFPWVNFDVTTSGTGPEWRIRATTGFLDIYNIERSQFPVCISALAPSDAIHISHIPTGIQGQTGDVAVGIGGAADSDRNFQVRSTSAVASMRLKSSTSAWDLISIGNEFGIRDETTPFFFPFAIEKGSPTDSLRIEVDGDISIGEGANAASHYPLHVFRDNDTALRIAQFTQRKTNGTVVVGFENNATASTANNAGFDFALQSSTQQRVAGRFICSFINTNDATRTGAFKFFVANNGGLLETMRLTGGRVSIGTSNATHLLRVGNATCNGSVWANASSRELKQDITPLTTAAAREAVMSLAPVTYAYKAEPGEQHVGFIAEDVPALVAMPDGKTLSSMDIVAALTKVVQEQERELETSREKQATLEARLQALEAQLSAR
ncbi:MAG: tail fiber domain-containing protein [Planctomycetaceae bacterium]